MAKELSELTDGEFKNLINFITNNKIYYDTNQYNNKLLITILCILGIVFTIAVITVLIYSIKKKCVATVPLTTVQTVQLQ